MKIGVIACDIMKRELDRVLDSTPGISQIIYLEAALHCKPKHMKQVIKEKIDSIKDSVDLIFIGYGYCQSLKGIEDEYDIPIILPQFDDCIAILFTPEKYAEEVRKEVGTWFMTPGWAEVGAEMVIKENHLDRVVKYGKDPMEMAKRLFTHYRRGLYIDTHVGDNEYFIGKAKQFCADFNLRLEQASAQSDILERYLKKLPKLNVSATSKPA
jgi:hypothetical protein